MTYKKSSAGLQLESASFGEGMIRVTGSNSGQSEVDYFLTDHLGSVRVIVAGSLHERVITGTNKMMQYFEMRHESHIFV